MRLITKDYYSWHPNRYCVATNPKTGVETKLKGYRGVTKLLNFGEPTFEEKLVAKMGYNKAMETLARVRKRGTSIHSQLETDKRSLINKDVLTSLGANLGDEVLVYGNLLGADVIGFIDSVYRLPSGRLCLVDWKSKKDRKSFKHYNPGEAVHSYYNQLVTYAALFKSLYDEPIDEIKVVMLYKQDPMINDVYSLNRSEFLPHASYLANKVKLYLGSKS